jgi:hypothetical protein
MNFLPFGSEAIRQKPVGFHAVVTIIFLLEIVTRSFSEGGVF